LILKELTSFKNSDSVLALYLLKLSVQVLNILKAPVSEPVILGPVPVPEPMSYTRR